MISLKDIKSAKERIENHVIRTPLLRIPALDDLLGCQVYLKAETLQYTGSFKLRGATNKLLALSEIEKKSGVVCASSGNHAQGVACAAKNLDIDAVIVMPENCNRVKLEGAKKFGAKVILEGTQSSQREAKALELVKDENRVLVHPYDDDYIRAGQGTIGLEILEDAPDMDVIVVPIGGGGLISGVSVAAKGIKPSIKIIGVEPAGASRYGLSRQAQMPVQLEKVDTIADGTRTDTANPMSYDLIEKYVDNLYSVDDECIRSAMKLSVADAKIVAEPSSVMGIAAGLSQQLSVKSTDKVCFVITGGNTDLSLLRQVLKES